MKPRPNGICGAGGLDPRFDRFRRETWDCGVPPVERSRPADIALPPKRLARVRQGRAFTRRPGVAAVLTIMLACLCGCSGGGPRIVTPHGLYEVPIASLGTDSSFRFKAWHPNGNPAFEIERREGGQSEAFRTAVSEVSSIAKVWLIAGAVVDAIKAAAGMSAVTTAPNGTVRAVGPAADAVVAPK